MIDTARMDDSKLDSQRILGKHTRRVAVTGDLGLFDFVPDLRELLFRYMHLGRFNILLHILELFRAGDRYDVLALRRQPRER